MLRKRDLNSAYHLAGEISDIERQLHKLWSDSNKYLVGDSANDYKTGKAAVVSLYGFSEEYYEREARLIEKLTKKREKLIRQRMRIESELDQIGDACIRRIIRLRYFERYSWDAVAIAIDGTKGGDAMRKRLDNFFEKK